MNSRDLQLTIRQRFDQKQNLQNFTRVVITDHQGNQTGAGSIWANRRLRRVWYMKGGAAQPAQAYCSGAKIPNPQIGMRAFLGFAENSNEPELFEDPTLRKTNTTGQPVTITPEDLQPGGRYFLWIQSKAIQPLSTFPTSNTGLKVTVVAGYYPYIGVRKYYGGVIGLSLAASVPTIGLKRKVGLYLDASNILQTVNGSTAATTAIAPEPTWPAGAFRLSTVELEYGQTSIDFSTDIEDARMIWSDENGGGGSGWPFDNVLTVSTTNTNADFDNLPDAITAAAAGDTILIDENGISVSATITINKALVIACLGTRKCIITSSVNSGPTLYPTADNVVLNNLLIRHTGAGTTSGCIATNNAGLVLDNCQVEKTSGTPSTAYGVWMFGGSVTLRNGTTISVTAGTTKYGIYNDTTDATITIFGGQIGGDTQDIYGSQAGSTLNISNCWLTNNLLSWAGTITDQARVSKLYESDFGAVAWRTDAAGGLAGNGTRDIFPQASANGINARFERLFGDDVPANSYLFTRRTFTVNAFASGAAGFEDSQSSPYSFGGSPGGFSLSVPASSYSAESATYPHWLNLRNYHASTPLYLQWTSSTAKNNANFIMAVTPNPAASDLLVAEIRVWDVQSPGGSDNYWAFRWQWLGSTYPAYPFVLSAYRGTGTTFAVGDGTMLQRYQAVTGQVNAILVQPQASNTCAFISRVAEGFNNFSAGFAQAGYPSNFKTMRLYLPTSSYHEVFLDQVVIT